MAVQRRGAAFSRQEDPTDINTEDISPITLDSMGSDLTGTNFAPDLGSQAPPEPKPVGVRENRQTSKMRSINTPTLGQSPNIGFAQGSSVPGGVSPLEGMSPSGEGSSFAQGGGVSPLSPPSPESMVFPSSGGGQKLFGRRGGQFGGGLGVAGQDSMTGGTEDPSALIESLLKLINQG